MNAKLPARCAVACAAAIALLGGCASAWVSPLARDHPLAGRIWDVKASRFVSEAEVTARVREAGIIILGEVHDNTDHHRLQAKLLAAVLETGRRPILAMEQFDHERQAALDAARARAGRDARDAGRIATAGGFDREGWRWPDYRPLIELALTHDLVLRAANFSRRDARALIRAGRPAAGLPAAPAALRAALEEDIVEGHCGHRPAAPLLSGMIEAQRARDAQMARSLDDAGKDGAVLIAGAGHARRDRAVPYYLSAEARSRLLSVAFVELEAGSNDPRDYVRPAAGGGQEPIYDLLWFTPRAEREDPCRTLRLPPGAAPR